LAANSLREELLALDGVAEAEVDESADSPSGVRVRLEPDADARIVGIEVQRVLAAHGLRSKITDDEAADQPQPPPPVGLEEPDGSPATIGTPPIPPPPLTPPPAPPPAGAGEPTAAPSVRRRPTGLRSIAVEESAEGISVIATAADGRIETRRSTPSEEEMAEAVVLAVAALAGAGDIRVVSVAPAPANGSEVVTVVVAYEDGSKSAGAAVVDATRGWAVGRAAWSAMAD
jgi:hypothetical protein